MLEHLSENKKVMYLGIFMVWLFHVSAIIGMSVGDSEWFLSKTTINLLVALFFLILCYPILSEKSIKVAGFVFMTGMVVEWIGVHNDWLFGSYYYGNNLGPKIYGVPLLIGVNWLTLLLQLSLIWKEL